MSTKKLTVNTLVNAAYFGKRNKSQISRRKKQLDRFIENHPELRKEIKRRLLVLAIENINELNGGTK